MTTASFSNVFDSTTDAGFRSWGSAISAALQAVGLVQTTDTGQINWTTVTSPTGTSAASERIAGYEVYKFNDSLQATKPIYIKIEYGTYFNANNTPAGGEPTIYMTMGTGSNGAGTLAGLVTARQRVLGNNAVFSGSSATPAAPTTLIPCYFSGDGSYFTMALGVTSAGPFSFAIGTAFSSAITLPAGFPAVVVIERTHDTTGVGTSNGAIFMSSNWNSNSNTNATAPTVLSTFLSFTTSATASSTSALPVGMPGTGFGTGAIGSNQYAWPLVVATPDPQPQCLSALAIYPSDLSPASTFSIPVLGSTHTYLACSGNAAGARSKFSNRPGASLAVRYE